MATKGAVTAFTKALAIDEAAHGVRVNSVSPGNIYTPLWQEAIDAAPDPARWRAEGEAAQLVGRMGTAEEAGRLCLFIAAEATFTTGRGSRHLGRRGAGLRSQGQGRGLSEQRRRKASRLLIHDSSTSEHMKLGSLSKRSCVLVLSLIVWPCASAAQTSPAAGAGGAVSKVWVADNGDGTYKNPVLHADYSDPDAVRVGDDYYMTSSSFNAAPGLPILHSKDLVNWRLVGHVFRQQPPYEVFRKTQHGGGVWAPSIRHHNGEFYIYYPDPDRGIYVVKAKDAAGPWSEPLLVKEARGWIDPCPLWDEDGNAYLVSATAASRSGIKSILVVSRMSADGTKLLDDPVIVFDGHEKHPTVEGPKFYKRNGYYYIFAPAGGVEQGWQLVLRSKNVYGPYEEKIVLAQGKTKINGPHQGAWVETQTGESWFLHFQDKGPYGRIVHLQPVRWVNDWPVMGADADGDGTGEPVLKFKKPNVGKSYPTQTPPESDEFDSTRLGLAVAVVRQPADELDVFGRASRLPASAERAAARGLQKFLGRAEHPRAEVPRARVHRDDESHLHRAPR